jgi:hypothetical protein
MVILHRWMSKPRLPALTRRRDLESREESWLVYYGDVHVGTIGIRTGVPHDEDP